MSPATPPRWAERALRWSLSRSERPAVLGDLQEEFEELAAGPGPKAAARWYWRQTLSSVGPNLTRRVRRAYSSEEARASRRSSRVAALLIALAGAFIGLVAEVVTPDGWVAGAGVSALALMVLVTGLFQTRTPAPQSRVVRLSLVSAMLIGAILDLMGHASVGLSIIVAVNVWIYWPRRLRPRWLDGDPR